MPSVLDVAGRWSLALACRWRPGAGVIINGHTLTARQTRFQVDVLSRWFDFVHHDDLPERLARPRARPFCLLTFDDGKHSVPTMLAPELERLGVPAVFYVVTRFLRDGAPLWFDRQAALVRTLGRAPAGLELDTLKGLPLAQVTARLDRACAEYGVACDDDADDVRAMSWDDARALARRGFTIGAHSLRHAILTLEEPADAREDIAQSMAEVSAELGTPCRTFAFPNGNYTPELARYTVACGARTIMTTEPTWTDRRCPLWMLPRVQLFGEQSRGLIELKLAAAATGRLLTNPDGTGRLYRASQRPSSLHGRADVAR